MKYVQDENLKEKIWKKSAKHGILLMFPIYLYPLLTIVSPWLFKICTDLIRSQAPRKDWEQLIYTTLYDNIILGKRAWSFVFVQEKASRTAIASTLVVC